MRAHNLKFYSSDVVWNRAREINFTLSFEDRAQADSVLELINTQTEGRAREFVQGMVTASTAVLTPTTELKKMNSSRGEDIRERIKARDKPAAERNPQRPTRRYSPLVPGVPTPSAKRQAQFVEFGMSQDSDLVASREPPAVVLKPAIDERYATGSNQDPVWINAKAQEALDRAARVKERLANEARVAQELSQPSSPAAKSTPKTGKKKPQNMRPCWYFSSGRRCPWGRNCKFLHEGEETQASRRAEPEVPRQEVPHPCGAREPDRPKQLKKIYQELSRKLMLVVPEEFHESVKFHDSPRSKPNFLSQLQELYYVGLSDPCGKFLKTSAIFTGIYSLNAKVVADVEAQSRELTIPWDYFFAFEFDKMLEDQQFSLAGQFCLKVFEPPVSVVDKTKRKPNTGFVNPYIRGNEALEPKELVYRCGLIAKELESFRIMKNVQVQKIEEQLCTLKYDRDDFEACLYYIQTLDYKDSGEVPDHELAHFWESSRMHG